MQAVAFHGIFVASQSLYLFVNMASLVSGSQLQIVFKQSFIVVLLFIASASKAQHFSEKAKLDTVIKTGFYSISITSELSSYIKTDFSDLRITDEREQYLAYLISSPHNFSYGDSYSVLKITKNEITDSGRSVIILENQQGNLISSIALKIRNAAVSRNATISGSDDEQKWFAVKEGISLEKELSNDEDRYVQTLSFPGSSYRYYKLVIENGKNDPLNILEAGYFTSVEYKKTDNYIANPSVIFRQIDSSDHNSYIFVEQSYAYHTEKISINVEGPPFFKRDVDLIRANGNVSSFQIASGNVFSFYTPLFNDKKFFLRIYNGDNLPLHIANVYTAQESKNVITFLQAGKQYHLLMNDSSAIKPVYDLQQFKDSIIQNVQELKILSFKKIEQVKKEETTLWINKLLWPIIIVVVLVLATLTFRLTKEIQQKKNI
jgi:hypothetical protein